MLCPVMAVGGTVMAVGSSPSMSWIIAFMRIAVLTGRSHLCHCNA